ncbi:MAG: radical SAM protein [Omnitrophica WOR_2 bacterium RIFCSPHIGHO2_01_FULL_48_9]|nr:MAG: radical SAM protein [Omnitrophica WOR_2 bacterium RIFCSPHIGHO2_01_FULL_48_9]
MFHPKNISPEKLKGRGTTINPVNRFEPLAYERDEYCDAVEDPAVTTEFFKDTSKSIISTNDSPDIGFAASLNPYRGCEHGCIYCYARPTHEYFALSSGVDFESKIFVKEDAPQLLLKELAKPKWKPQVLVMSGVTDCYQPIERKLQITRRCLEVLGEFRNPVGIITKNHLVTRDIDILKPMTQYQGVVVNVSITSLDAKLARVMEPRASTPENRLQAIRELTQAGIPVNVMLAPIIPGLNEHEIPALLKKCVAAGAQSAAYVVVRLPYAVKDLFAQWLGQHYPDRKEKVLNRIRALRGGKLNDPRFGERMGGQGIFAEQIDALFQAGCKKIGFNPRWPHLSTEAFRNPYQKQLTFF